MLAEQLERARLETERAHLELAEHIATDTAQVESLRLTLSDSAPQREALHEAVENAVEALRVAEANLAEWQEHWDVYSRSSSEAAQAAEIERTRDVLLVA